MAQTEIPSYKRMDTAQQPEKKKRETAFRLKKKRLHNGRAVVFAGARVDARLYEPICNGVFRVVLYKEQNAADTFCARWLAV